MGPEQRGRVLINLQDETKAASNRSEHGILIQIDRHPRQFKPYRNDGRVRTRAKVERPLEESTGLALNEQRFFMQYLEIIILVLKSDKKMTAIQSADRKLLEE